MSRYIIAYVANQHADLLSGFAKKLLSDHGIRTIILCGSIYDLPNALRYQWDADSFDSIIDLESMLAPRAKEEIPGPAELAKRARRIEENLSVSIMDLVRTDRHMGRGFICGADTMRSFYSESTGYPEGIDILVRLCEFFEEIIERYAPIAIMSPFAPYYAAAISATAEKKGIPVVWPIFSRAGKKMFWATDRHNWPVGLRETYEAELAGGTAQESENCQDETPEPQLDSPHAMKMIYQQNMASISIRALIKTLYQQSRRYVGDRTKRRDRVYGRYYGRDRLWFAVERWLWRRNALKQTPVLPTVSDDLPFVFFPLHLEPEVALMSEAREADNQLTIIDWLCKTVPTGWYVVIKEHPNATLPRPRGFWSRVKNYPNVIVAAPFEPSDRIVDRAKAITVINGTVGVQAAIKGIPVLAFHRHFPAQLMPHVLFADSYETTRCALQTIENDDLPEFNDRIAAGKAFLRALEKCAFPIRNAGMLVGVSDGNEVESDDIDGLCHHFLKAIE